MSRMDHHGFARGAGGRSRALTLSRICIYITASVALICVWRLSMPALGDQMPGRGTIAVDRGHEAEVDSLKKRIASLESTRSRLTLALRSLSSRLDSMEQNTQQAVQMSEAVHQTTDAQDLKSLADGLRKLEEGAQKAEVYTQSSLAEERKARDKAVSALASRIDSLRERLTSKPMTIDEAGAHTQNNGIAQLQHTDVDVQVESKASLGLKLYLYPARFKQEGYLSYFYDALWKSLERSPRRTQDPLDADVYFLGTEHACEFNWPNYTHYPKSVDFIYGDMDTCRDTRKERTRAYIAEVAKQLVGPGTDRPKPSSTTGRHPVHVIVDMFGWTMKDPKFEANPGIAWAAPSFSMQEGFRMGMDIGFPAKNLMSFDRPGLLDCNRPLKYLLTFKGTVDATVRKNVATLDNGKDVRIVTQAFKANCGQKVEGDTEELCGAGQYADLMKNTQFGAVMRGDNLYSYRFLEVLSAGAVPVIFSDNWVLPFYEVVDYSKFALVVREKDWRNIISRLRAIPAERVCAMRREAQRVFRTHFDTFDGIAETTMQVFERRKAGTAMKPPIDWTQEAQ